MRRVGQLVALTVGILLVMVLLAIVRTMENTAPQAITRVVRHSSTSDATNGAAKRSYVKWIDQDDHISAPAPKFEHCSCGNTQLAPAMLTWTSEDTHLVQKLSSALQACRKRQDEPHSQFSIALQYVNWFGPLVWINGSFQDLLWQGSSGFRPPHADNDLPDPEDELPREMDCAQLAIVFSALETRDIADFMFRASVLEAFVHSFHQIAADAGIADVLSKAQVDLIVWEHDVNKWERELLRHILPRANVKTRHHLLQRVDATCWSHALLFSNRTPALALQTAPYARMRQRVVRSLARRSDQETLHRSVLLVIRKKAQRKWLNAYEVAAMLRSMQHTVTAQVWSGRLSFTRQVSLAHAHRVLIGVHGAELANILFMKTHSAVIELFPYMTMKQWCLTPLYILYQRLAMQLSLDYFAYRDMQKPASHFSQRGTNDSIWAVDAPVFTAPGSLIALVQQTESSDANSTGVVVQTCLGGSPNEWTSVSQSVAPLASCPKHVQSSSICDSALGCWCDATHGGVDLFDPINAYPPEIKMPAFLLQ